MNIHIIYTKLRKSFLVNFIYLIIFNCLFNFIQLTFHFLANKLKIHIFTLFIDITIILY